MQLSKLFMSAVAISALGGAAVFAYPHIRHIIDPTDGALAACEENLIAQLKSPSSYKRIEYKFFPRDRGLSLKEFQLYKNTHGRISGSAVEAAASRAGQYFDDLADRVAMEAILQKPYAQITTEEHKLWKDKSLKREYDAFLYAHDNTKSATLFLTYEAENSFGASLKDIHECNFAPPRKATGLYTTDEMFSYVEAAR